MEAKDKSLIEIDGSHGEGGGQILRTSLALSAIFQRPVSLHHIRAKRENPGLRPQHLKGVQALAEITGATAQGAAIGSENISFFPQKINPGEYTFEIGNGKRSAGSISLLLQTILPPLCFSQERFLLTLKGGTHVPWSPPFHYLSDVLFPVLHAMGVSIQATLERWGWYPRGGGLIHVDVAPALEMKPVTLLERGEPKKIHGLSAVSNLPKHVAERQRDEVLRRIEKEMKLEAEIRVECNAPAEGRGSFLFLVVESERAGAGFSALGAEFPNKPITLVISAVAGGTTDLTGRALANAARTYLGQPFIYDNRGGGGGSAAPTLVATRPPDGYTLGVLRQAATMNAYHLGNLNFHPLEDLTYIICFTGQWQGIVVRSDSQWKTIQDFVKYCKQRPNKVTYGTSGVGSGSHLVMEDFLMQAGIQMIHIPYKGNAETNAALLGGHLDAVNSSPGWAPLVDAGKFRLLVTSGLKRADRYPQVPTFKESGYDIINESAVDMIGPKGLPKPIVKKLHDAFKKAMDDPDFLSTLKKLDMSVIYMGPEELTKNAREEFEKNGRLAQKLGLKKKK